MPEQVTRSLIIKGSAQELYDLWSDYEKHPQFSESLKSVTKMNENLTRWVMKGPMGKEIEWTAEMTREEEARRIAWKTVDGDIKTSGQVTFTPLPNDETQVTVITQYVPPAGKVGEAIANLIANSEERVEKDLYRFKEYAENKTARHIRDKNR